jgi:hypothetical protein
MTMKNDEVWTAEAIPNTRQRYVIKDENGLIVAEVVGNDAARLIAAAPEMLTVLTALFEQCAMIHKHWGDGGNAKQADAAIEAGRALLARIDGTPK